MKKLLSAVFLFFLSFLIFAENRFNLNVKNAPEGSVRVFEVTRNEEIIGNIKSTTVELMFENQTNRILEGEFEFSLEDGEKVVGYSLDINGKMRKGVVVEKEKARTVFESEVRKGIDPGFVEKTVGNNFKTRVYPIPSHGIRKIEIVFEKEITENIDSDKTFTQTIGKETYFYFSENIDVPKLQNDVKKENLTILFDISDSAKNRNIQKELEFLKKYLQKIKNPKVKIITFANEIIAQYEASDFAKIEEFIKKQNFDGATNFNSFLSKIEKNENCILFSDGIENWGKSKNLTQYKISTVNSSKSANFTNLKKIANDNFGTFINLCETDSEKAIEKMLENPLRIVKIEADEKAISEIYPKIGSAVEKNISISGILYKKSANIKISLGRNGKIEKTIAKSISSINNEKNVESEKIARLWAMKKIEDLEIDKDSNKKEIIETAKKFSVVTDETSLIVLDNVSQYFQHGIVPPEELKEEYEKFVANQNQFKPNDNSQNGIPKFVYQKFTEFENWWNKKPKDFEKENRKLEKKGKLRLSSANNEIETVESTIDLQQLERLNDTFEALTVSPESIFMAESNQMENRSIAQAKRVDSVSRSNFDVNSYENGRSIENNVKNKIELKPWSSESSYIAILKKTETEKMYEKYLELKKEYSSSPAFFMEVSDYFIEENLYFEAVRILSNLSEMNLENSDILRALGNKLVEQEKYDLAIYVFEKLTKIRSEIPQFYRDLALAYNLNGEKQKAIENLWFVASKSWDSRFNEIQQTCLNDMNSIIATSKKLDISKVDSKLQKNFDCDIRVVLTWNTDDCDVDLWVTDPNSEKCFYGHKLTKIGGRMSRDFTQGYGPEEFCIRNAQNGTYKIEANYFGNHQQKLLQPITVQAEVYTNFGRKNQKREVLTLQLKNVKGTFEIGQINF